VFDGQRASTVTAIESDVRLRESFQALAELPGPDLSPELRERIWLAVSGELPPVERRALVDRMATDPACAEAWRVAHEMWQSLHPADAATSVKRTTWWTSPWLAAAATVLVVTAVGIVSLVNRPPADEFRASPAYTVSSLIAADMPLPRDKFLLRWTPAPEGSRYQLRVTSEDLRVLVSAADLMTPEFVVLPAHLSALPNGAAVFWQIDVWLPTGERTTSPTFVVRVE